MSDDDLVDDELADEEYEDEPNSGGDSSDNEEFELVDEGDDEHEPDDEDAQDEDVEDAQDDDEDDDEIDDEEEFSLDQLSAAYAEVLAGKSGPDTASSDDASEAAEEAPDDSNQDDGHLEPVELERPSQPEVDPEEVLAKELSACPVTPESILEAILFVGSPKEVKLSSRKIAAILRDISPKEVTKMAKELAAKYEKENRAYAVASEKGVHKIVLAKDLAEVQRRFLGRDRAVRLNQSVIDVLAVVAYNQPVSREQVDKIRGKSSGGILKQMVRRELLTVEDTDEKPKRRLFRTTDRFLDLFELDSIEDLPQSHDVEDIDGIVE